MEIKVLLKCGDFRTFNEDYRPGGSYENKIEYHDGWVIITDVWGNATALPSSDIQEIETTPRRL